MKPERVQLAPLDLAPGTSEFRWAVSRNGFESACKVFDVICKLLRGSSLERSVRVHDEGLELWVGASRPEDLGQLESFVERLSANASRLVSEARD
jgi:hypothetical protein